MNLVKTLTLWGVLAVMAVLAFVPTAALASPGSRQSNKNNWRNAAIGAGAIAAYGLLKHDTTTTLLGAAGAAYSAHRYGQDRHSQSQAQRARERRHRYFHHRHSR